MAIAPERTGIGIRRYFTTPGVDPYDTVTWELRDARITNWATGAVAFEQLGVEVPSGWSVKRHQHPGPEVLPGHLGHAGAEWSLKQVVDRVVGTIVAWGTRRLLRRRPGGETFEAELKWLIIHQRALSTRRCGSTSGRGCAPAGQRVFYPCRRRFDGLDPQLVRRRRQDFQRRVRGRDQSFPHPVLPRGPARWRTASGPSAS